MRACLFLARIISMLIRGTYEVASRKSAVSFGDSGEHASTGTLEGIAIVVIANMPHHSLPGRRIRHPVPTMWDKKEASIEKTVFDPESAAWGAPLPLGQNTRVYRKWLQFNLQDIIVRIGCNL